MRVNQIKINYMSEILKHYCIIPSCLSVKDEERKHHTAHFSKASEKMAW
jgi:hypothetical protein